MKVSVIGGANIDITAQVHGRFIAGDSNPGTVRLSMGGVARNIAHNLLLLGDEVRLITVFGDDILGRIIQEDCRRLGLDIRLSEVVGASSQPSFISVNSPSGDLLGGVSAMDAVEAMTPEWLGARMDMLNGSDAVVIDANLSAESIAFLLSGLRVPVYLDAVSAAKAPRIREAVLESGGRVHSLKCNRLEDSVLGELPGVSRRYVTLGSEGIRIEEEDSHTVLPALPANVVNVTGGGDALLAGIVHAGPDAPAEAAARLGLLCAKCAIESMDAVNPILKYIQYE